MSRNWRADPLVWGHGPTVFEVFLEPTCPFSVKALGKLDALRASQRALLDANRAAGDSRPWTWAAFILSGEVSQ